MAATDNAKKRRNKKSPLSTLLHLITLLACVIIIGGLLSQVWMKWHNNESIALTPYTMPNWKVPFPAVTICSESKIRQTLYNFTENYHKLDSLEPDELSMFESLSLVCGNHVLDKGREFSEFTNETVIDLIKSVAPDLKSLLYACLWKTTIENCESFFTPIITDEGLCFTFNLLEPDELFTDEMSFQPYSKNGTGTDGWSWDEGYLSSSKYDAVPIKAADSGALSGLTVVLRTQNDDMDRLCRGTSQGFKISLHSPTDFPSVTKHFVNIPFEKEVTVKIKPKVLVTSKDLVDHNYRKNLCYFSNERKLQFFKRYSEKNCELECLSKYTYVLCGCVTFAMPRDSSMPICSAGSTECAIFAQSDLSTRKIKLKFSGNKQATEDDLASEVEEGLNEMVRSCDCLPSCTSVDYEYETSQAKFDKKLIYNAYKQNYEEDENLARVTLYFENSQLIAYKQTKVANHSYIFATTVAVLGILLLLTLLGTLKYVFKLHKIYFTWNKKTSSEKVNKTEIKV